jgi:hypothetical protein
MTPMFWEPSLLSRFQGALGGLLWGCDLADRSRLAYHLGQAVAAAIALETPPIALAPTVPLVEALALTLPWVLLSFDQRVDQMDDGAAFGAIVANHGDREVLELWRRLLLRGLGGEPATGWSDLDRRAQPLSQALNDSLTALDQAQPFGQSLGQVLDRIQSRTELTIAERSLAQAIGLGRELQGQMALVDRYSQRQRSQLEAASRPLLFSLMGTTGRGNTAPLAPLGLDTQAWGESLLRAWAGILGSEVQTSGAPGGSRRSPNPAGVPAVTSGIQTIRL